MTQVPLHSRNTAKILFIHGIRDIPESVTSQKKKKKFNL